MKVKVAELKSRLSHYLREAGESGQEIVICVRETPVAYLVACGNDARTDPAEQAEAARLREALAAVGLSVAPGLAARRPLPPVRPMVVAQGGRSADTVRKIRGEKEW